jgi:hypothetical protein
MWRRAGLGRRDVGHRAAAGAAPDKHPETVDRLEALTTPSPPDVHAEVARVARRTRGHAHRRAPPLWKLSK